MEMHSTTQVFKVIIIVTIEMQRCLSAITNSLSYNLGCLEVAVLWKLPLSLGHLRNVKTLSVPETKSRVWVLVT